MSKPVKWAADAVASLVQDVGINHSRSYILVLHQLLDGSDIIHGLKQMVETFPALRPRRRLTNGEYAGEPSLIAQNVRV